MNVQLLQQDRQHHFQLGWGKNHFRGGTFPFLGCRGLTIYMGGRAAAGLSEAGSHKLRQKWGWRKPGLALRALPTCPSAISGIQGSRPAASSAREGGQASGRKGSPSQRVIANPTLAHVWGGGREPSKVIKGHCEDMPAGCFEQKTEGPHPVSKPRPP